jgi:exodeoxyribonuclease V gamma subunit
VSRAVLTLHRSERADLLADELAGLLATPLGEPVAAEVVAVPTRGVERWLAQRLSDRLGVCANLRFPFPAAVVGAVTAALSGVDPSTDPWRPERSVWPLVELIDEHARDPLIAPLADHLRASVPPAGPSGEEHPLRYPVARRLADLFDRYATHRPELVLAWASQPGSPSDHWQAHLWRMLRDRIGSPGPAERLELAASIPACDASAVDLPERLSVFGLTRIPSSHLRVLKALAGTRDVHLFLLHPSRGLWDAVAGTAPLDLSRRADRTEELARNPILRTWGRDAREMQLVLAANGVTGGRHVAVPHNTSMLGLLQRSIRDNSVLSASHPVDPADTSVRVHACHGRARQMEVARDAILHLLEDDPTLEARDVIVMCPDVDVFAPLVQAAFPGEGGAVPALRVRLADRSLRETNPLLGVASDLLGLATARLTATEVLDFASRPAVRLRFGFDQDDLSTVEGWVARAGVRWGLDAGHRRRWALGGVASNTWAFGLDRLALGAAMPAADCRLFGGVTPEDGVTSAELDLAGRFAELVHRLAVALGDLSGRRPLAAWLAGLARSTDSLAACAPGAEWQREQLLQTLALVEEEAGATAVSVPLGVDEVRSVLSVRLAGRPTRANFRTGDVTVCTLVPMRSVPHRVVCVVGLDDGAFPRSPQQDGDDLLAGDPRVGDRDAGLEDRQLLLDALMAATDHLILTYSGRDERTNRPRPPCTPLAELLDALDSSFEVPGRTAAREHVVVEHPLQPFDRRNFLPSGLGGHAPWSFDATQLAGARAASGQGPPRPWLEGPLSDLGDEALDVDRLVLFAQHPVRQFLRTRLNLYLSDRADGVADSIPVEPDPLTNWAAGDRLLEACLAGLDLSAARDAELARGALPPGALGETSISSICDEVQELLSLLAALGLDGSPAESVEVRVDLPGGPSVTGTVGGLRSGRLVSCTYSRLGPRQRLASWVRHLVLCAQGTTLAGATVTLGRGEPRQRAGCAFLAPLPSEEAAQRLARVVDLYRRGMRWPLPMSCEASAAWAATRHRGGSVDEAWREALGAWRRPDPDLEQVYGPNPSLGSLVAEEPWSDEHGPGWPAAEPHRFGTLAVRLWGDLLDCEERARG